MSKHEEIADTRPKKFCLFAFGAARLAFTALEAPNRSSIFAKLNPAEPTLQVVEVSP